jgi:hypothetical protein
MINFYRPRSEACRKIKNDPNLVVLRLSVSAKNLAAGESMEVDTTFAKIHV